MEGTSHERVRQSQTDIRESYEEFDAQDESQAKRVQNMYRIMDTVVSPVWSRIVMAEVCATHLGNNLQTFNIDLSQHTSAGWTPAPNDLDLQVSLVMLDPYVTMNLTARGQLATTAPSSGNLSQNSLDRTPRSTRYSSTFRLPDKHGVYTFVVDWKRHGWSYVNTRDTTPVRPLNSDEHPRFLHAAFPYVAGAASTVTAFLLFSLLWITSDDQGGKDKRKEE